MNLSQSVKVLLRSLFFLASSLVGDGIASKIEGLCLDGVISALNEDPVGTVESSNTIIVYFRLGQVWFENGVVARYDLMTPEQFSKRETLAKVHQEEAVERMERLRKLRIEEGEFIRNQRLRSASFLGLEATEQVRFWRQFQVTYPEIDVSAELQNALTLHQSEETERRRQAEMQSMRERLEIAEMAARRAAQEANIARREAERATARRPIYWWDATYSQRPLIMVPQSRNPIRIIHHNPPRCAMPDAVSPPLQ